MSSLLKDKITNLPKAPGVYLFKNKFGKIIYIGKAKSLYHRVRSYFNAPNLSVKTEALVSKVFDLDVIVTQNEVEALILESNLIKQYKPRYNINLKDDKSYPYIVITNEDFPQVYPTRKVLQNGSKYFGPYTEVKTMRYALKVLRDVFKIRSCKYNLTPETIQKRKYKVCLDYHIKKCDGPCEGLVSKEEYNKMIYEVEQVLRGKIDPLIHDLTKEMFTYSENLEFEKANEIKNKIEALKVYGNSQKVVSQDLIDRDIVTFAAEVPFGVSSVFNVRSGKLIGKRKHIFNYHTELPEEEIYFNLIRLIYDYSIDLPDQIIIPFSLPEKESAEKWLNKKYNKLIKILEPDNDDIKSLTNLCWQNALLDLNELKIQQLKKEPKIPLVLRSLQRDLYLPKPPIRIECFDVSTLQGADTVASLVVFEYGKPKKSDYRKFIIKTVKSMPDDFASMSEVIERHYKRILEEGKKLPDLIMVDGGKGQLASAIKSLNKLGITNVNIVALAKRLEEVFIPNKKDSIMIPRTSSSLKLLQQVRNEAHRFAITFHRQRRTKRIISTELVEIQGIGEKFATKLLQAFGSIEDIKKANHQELEKVVGKFKAQKIIEYFSNK